MSSGQSEINKLKEILKKLPQEKSDEKRREVLKKVIAYMTLGVDVSKLFPEMIMMSSTNDIIQKKMIYLYLNNYAETNSELSLLTINTLQKDSRDEDPTVRGLALRSFCNLRIKNLLEYIEGPLFNGLNDRNPYVRRIAITSCVKLLKMNPNLPIKEDIIRILKNMLLDYDPQSIINAIHALNEILMEEGGVKVNKEIIFNMLNKLSSFNEWGKCVVLNTVSTYIPENEDEMYDIMNILENHIRDFSSAVFLASLKCFLNLSMGDTDLQIQIFERMKDPLLTLISTSPSEISYVVLLHTNLLLHEANKLNYNTFDYDYKHFFFRYNDMTYIKEVKLDILVALASKNNVISIINELNEYTRDPNDEIVQKTIRSIGAIAIKIPKVISRVVELALSSFLYINNSVIVSTAIRILVDILRKYDEYTKIIIEEIVKCDYRFLNEEGIISYLWIIGEYCESIEDAPYILEEYVDQTTGTYLFMLELLTASLKVLAKRPVEMKPILAQLFTNILKNHKYPELTDKMFFYYNLLNYNCEEAFRIVTCKKDSVKNFVSCCEHLLLDELFNEFNTLSVVYKQPKNKFVTYSKISFAGAYDPEQEINEDSIHDSTQDVQSINSNMMMMNKSRSASSYCVSEQSSVDHRENNLLNIDDMLIMEEKNNHNEKEEIKSEFNKDNQQTNREEEEEEEEDVSLLNCNTNNTLQQLIIESNQMNPDTYQEQWGKLQEKNNEQIFLNSNSKPITFESMEELMTNYNISVLATGEIKEQMKFYMYAQLINKSYVYIELIFDKNEYSINWKLKSDCQDNHLIDTFSDLFRDIFIDFM